jgi:UPF0755 protein
MNFTTTSINSTNKQSKRKSPKFKLLLLIAVLAIGGYFGYQEWNYHQDLVARAGFDNNYYDFQVDPGQSPQEIAQKLADNNFIVSTNSFLRYAESEGLDNQFQAGRFFLSKNENIPTIAQALTNAEPLNEIEIVIQEGLTIEEIDSKLAKTGLINEGEFVDCVFTSCELDYEFLPADRNHWEGYFFPATYKIIPDQFTIEEFTNRILEAFESNYQVLKPEIAESGRTLKDIVIMASIIEKETLSGAERPMVADIFWRRLDDGWPLGADATVRYFTKNKTGAITQVDLDTDNPFNTRKNPGLTPHPIANPGLESLKAAINPEPNDYWFFLHDNKMQIHYAITVDQHNANKAKYID